MAATGLTSLGVYKVNQFLYYFGVGLGSFIMPWLLVVLLESSAQQVGIAQALISVPTVLLLLLGGVMADKANTRKLLPVLHLAAVVPPLVLFGLIQKDYVSLEVVVLYGISMAIIFAFTTPTREKLLSNAVERTPGSSMMKAVGTMISLQYLTPLLGIMVVMVLQTEQMDIFLVLLLIAGAFALAAPLVLKILPRGAETAPERREPKRKGQYAKDLKKGLSVVWQHQELRSVMLMVSLSGIFGVGLITVIIPLMIRDVFMGGADALAIAIACTGGGVGVASFLFSKVKQTHEGRSLILFSFVGIALMLVMAFATSLLAFLVTITVWGLIGGVSMTLSRTIIQVKAEAAERGRILSVWILSMFLGNPISALLSGFLSEIYGPQTAIFVLACGMFVVVVQVALISPVWKIKLQHE